jgi:hypothetical protein
VSAVGAACVALRVAGHFCAAAEFHLTANALSIVWHVVDEGIYRSECVHFSAGSRLFDEKYHHFNCNTRQ